MSGHKRYKYIVLLDRAELKLFFVPEKRTESKKVVIQKLEDLGYEAPKIVREKYHRPRVVNHKIFYSVTHTETGMFLLISPKNMAIDAEEIRDYNAGICKILGLPKLSNRVFFKYFTEREAILKLNNKTLCNIKDDLPGKVMTFFYKNIIIAIAYE